MHLLDVLEKKNCYAEDVLKTFSRRLEDQEVFAGLFLSFSNTAANTKYHNLSANRNSLL